MAAETGKSSQSLATTLIVVLLLSLMGAGVGFAVGVVLQPDPDSEVKKPARASKDAAPEQGLEPGVRPAEGDTKDQEEDPAGETVEEILTKDLKVVPLPPIVTTLAGSDGQWVRLEGSILTAPGGDVPADLLVEKSGEQILAYLRTVTIEQLQGPSGFLSLRDDLNETVRSQSGGQVQAVAIHGLMFE